MFDLVLTNYVSLYLIIKLNVKSIFVVLSSIEKNVSSIKLRKEVALSLFFFL